MTNQSQAIGDNQVARKQVGSSIHHQKNKSMGYQNKTQFNLNMFKSQTPKNV